MGRGNSNGNPARGGGRGNGGRGRGNRKSRDSNNSNRNTTTARKKTLADHQYYVGSAKQASDYVTVTNFIINYIRKTFKKGEDSALALEKFEEYDFTTEAPTMKTSSITDKVTKDKEDRQYEKQFEIEYAAHNDRVE